METFVKTLCKVCKIIYNVRHCDRYLGHQPWEVSGGQLLIYLGLYAYLVRLSSWICPVCPFSWLANDPKSYQLEPERETDGQRDKQGE